MLETNRLKSNPRACADMQCRLCGILPRCRKNLLSGSLVPHIPCSWREHNSRLIDHPEGFRATSIREAFQRFTNTPFPNPCISSIKKSAFHAPPGGRRATSRSGGLGGGPTESMRQPGASASKTAEDVQPISCARPGGRVVPTPLGRGATRGDLLPSVGLRTESTSNLQDLSDDVLGLWQSTDQVLSVSPSVIHDDPNG